MISFPAPATAMVETMQTAAAEMPERAVAFQGCPGANSHRAAMDALPEALPLPCFSFEDALEAVKDGRAGSAPGRAAGGARGGAVGIGGSVQGRRGGSRGGILDV